jgi:hypothetical protein
MRALQRISAPSSAPAGAAGFLLKHSASGAIVHAIEFVHVGHGVRA